MVEIFKKLLAAAFIFVTISEFNSVQCKDFQVVYEWSVVNYTWPDSKTYKKAINSKSYVPENNFLGSMKIFQDTVYFNIPDARGGTPVTLVSMSLNEREKLNQKLKPFPSWKLNKKGDCKSLQNAQNIEIDPFGVMWVIDGMRTTEESSKCPPKLVLLDLKMQGRVIHTYEFPNEIVLQNGGYLNDLVVDGRNGDYAYITDNSAIDPGLVIYSREKNKAWKIRDRTMFAELDAANFTVEGVKVEALAPIDGICLSPKPKGLNDDRKVYYTPLVGFNIYSISAKILQDEDACKGDTWRESVKLEGKRPERCDGLAMDNKGRIYAALFATNGIGFWDTNKPFSTNSVLYRNKNLMIWPDTFAFDNKGSLFTLSDSLYKLMVPTIKLKVTSEVLFRVFKTDIGAKSYQYID